MSKIIMQLREWLPLVSGLMGAIWWALEPYMRTGHFDLATNGIDIIKAVGLAVFSYIINYALKNRQVLPTKTTDNGKTTTKECAGGANDGCDTHHNDSAAKL